LLLVLYLVAETLGREIIRERRAWPESGVERRLAAILAADVAGYSRLMGADEEGTLAALKAIRRELGDPKVAEHRGRIPGSSPGTKTTGNGLLVECPGVVDAVPALRGSGRAAGQEHRKAGAGLPRAT
jgi:class 3 adenylate cyclase